MTIRRSARDEPMPKLLPHLSEAEQEQLFADLNYLNTREFRSFCDSHAIPYRIWIETADGDMKRTKDADRKPIVLNRIRHYLRTGKILKATCLSPKVVALTVPPETFESTDRLCYGWYNKKNQPLIHRLRELTDGRFKDGALARVLIMEFWTQSKAPTLAAYAQAWVKATRDYDLLTPEYAYLTDLRNQQAGKTWKAVRVNKAKRVMRILRAIPRPQDGQLGRGDRARRRH